MRKLFRGGLLPLLLVSAVLLGVSLRVALAAEEGQPAAEGTEEAGGHSTEAAGHDGGEQGHEGGGGVPLQFRTDLALWSLVVFLIFLWVLKRFAWGPLIAGLDSREGKIRQDMQAAEQSRRQAEELLAQHQQKLDQAQDEVKEILAEARRDAERLKQDILSEARNEAETTRQRAIHDIEQARDQALDELFNTMADQVVGATEHVLRRSLTDEDRSRLVEEAVNQFSTRP